MSKNTEFSRLNQRDTAEILGVTARTLRDWSECPRNPDGTYHAAAVVAWYAHKTAVDAGELDPERERARRDKEAADKLALENAVTRGDLAPISVMEEEVTALIADMRTNALGMGAKVAPTLVGLSASEIQSRIDDAIYELLTELSNYGPEAPSAAEV